MNLFGGLFSGLVNNDYKGRNYNDKRTYQQQNNDDALYGILKQFGNTLYYVKVPKRLRKYAGTDNYNDPKYRYSSEPRKRIR